MTQQKSQLHKTLWDIANTLRGNMGADEFRDYILGFIFYKYLSEKLWFTPILSSYQRVKITRV
jgi:type I restriction enzyme M protein